MLSWDRLLYFLDQTPGCQSADCMLCAGRQKKQMRQFERWILQASRTYYVHSIQCQNEQRRLKRVKRLIGERRNTPFAVGHSIHVSGHCGWTWDPSIKFHCNLFITFWIMLVTDKQTNKQTNASKNKNLLCQGGKKESQGGEKERKTKSGFDRRTTHSLSSHM